MRNTEETGSLTITLDNCPFTPGQELYQLVRGLSTYYCQKCYITAIVVTSTIDGNDWRIRISSDLDSSTYNLEDIGITLFLTEQQAKSRVDSLNELIAQKNIEKTLEVAKFVENCTAEQVLKMLSFCLDDQKCYRCPLFGVSECRAQLFKLVDLQITQKGSDQI